MIHFPWEKFPIFPAKSQQDPIDPGIASIPKCTAELVTVCAMDTAQRPLGMLRPLGAAPAVFTQLDGVEITRDHDQAAS